VVIGGGIMGASTAYHLARRGGAHVVLLESADMFGTGSTGLNAGGVRHQFSTAVNIELSRLSIALMERFPDEMGQDLSLRRCGYLFLLDNSADLRRFRENVALQNRHGVPSRIVSPNEIALLAPEVNLDGVVGGSWCALDGLVDPHGLLQGYITGARTLGVALLNNAPVTALEADDGRLHRVVTPRGAINTRTAVVAAGPWSAQIGALAGISIPIQPIRRQIAVTRPAVRVRDDFPFVIDFSRALYFHREGDGILTGMSNRDEEPGFDTRVDEEWQSHHLERAMARMPFLADAELVTQWAGLYEVTPDDQPIMGKLPGVEGLFICAGFSGHGLMHGPGAGLLMAEEIMDGQAHTIDISPLRWQRFADNAAVGEYNVV
jgi:sarcosine oxidase subunit beta